MLNISAVIVKPSLLSCRKGNEKSATGKVIVAFILFFPHDYCRVA